MKKIFLISMLAACCMNATSQNINSDFWCINSIDSAIDINGQHYMFFDIYNNDTALDSGYYYTAIEALISGNDTIRPNYYPYSYFSFTNSDTTETYRIDTVIAQNLISGLLLRKGMPGCGMSIMEAIKVSKLCKEQNSLGIDEIQLSDMNVYPNPANSYVNIIFKNGNRQKNNCHIELKNTLGQGVYATDVNLVSSPFVQIDISKFTKGIYILTINHTLTQKIVIQ